MLNKQVNDPALWYATVEHWLAHGWNPKNVPGMLELYQRGGPDHCQYCTTKPSQDQIKLIEKVCKGIENSLTS